MADDARWPARRVDRWLLVGYAVLALLFWWPLLGGGQTLWFDDTNHWYYPIRALCYGELRHGRVPLWTPLFQAGYPILAEGQSGVLYPPQLLFWLLPPPLALSWTVVLHTWLAAAFTHGFVRRLGVQPASAAVAAVAFMFSGAFVGHLVYLPMAFSLVWLPAACWGLEHALQRRSWAGFTAAGVALAMSLTAVHAQMAAYVALTALAYGALRAAGTPGWRWPAVAGLLWMGLLSGLLAAAQIVPLAELLGQTERGAGLDRSLLTQYGLSARWFLFLIMPRFFGHPTGPPLQWADLTVTWELDGFCGIVTVVLALLAPVVARRQGTWPLLAIWWGTFLLAWGHSTPLFEALHSLPVMQSFRIPARWLVPGTFAGAALAALALDAVRCDPRGARRRIGQFLPLVLVVFIAWLGLGWIVRDSALATHKIGAPEAARALHAIVWCAVCALGTLLALLAAPDRRWLAPALVALLTIELVATQRDFNPTAPPSVFSPAGAARPDPAALRLVAELHDGERIFVPPYADRWPFLSPSSNLLAGLPSIENFAPLRLARVDRVLNSWKDDVEERPVASRRDRWLRQVRRTVLETSPPLAAARLDQLRRWRVRYTLPAYGPPDAVADADGLYRVPGELAPRAWSAAGPVPYHAVTPTREEVGPTAGGVVAVNGTAYPGWRGYLPDGRRLWTGVAEGLFRAVAAPPAARVILVFEPTSWRCGLFVSLLTMAGLVAWARVR